MRKESKIEIVNISFRNLFEKLTNLDMFESDLKNSIIDEELRDKLKVTKESIHFEGKSILGALGLKNQKFSWDGKVEKTICRENYGEIQYSIKGSGLNSGTMWVQMIPIAENTTKIRLVVEADFNKLNPLGLFMAFAPSEQMQEAIDLAVSKFAENIEKKRED